MLNLLELEQVAYQRRPERTINIHRLLSALASSNIGDSPSLITRLAAAIAVTLSDPELLITRQWLQEVLVRKRSLTNLFTASSFGSADFVLRTILPVWNSASSENPDNLARFLALLSLDSEVDFDVERVFDLPSDLAQLVYLDWLTTKPVLTARGEKRREHLLNCADRLDISEAPLTLNRLVLATNAWMLSSYAAGRNKHKIKKVLNGAFRKTADTLRLCDAPLRAGRSLTEKPTLAVASEIMHSAHVQYRYFGQYLRQLRTRFHLVLVTEKKEVDQHVEALFDEIFTFERGSRGQHLTEIVAFLHRRAPDMVFWPSIGMRHWGPLIANLRLAPIQLTALGHSASTFSTSIDYFVTERGYVSDPPPFSETLILLPDESLRFERTPNYAPVPAEVTQSPNPLRVALPSNVLKLNPSFLRVLARIRGRTTRRLAFEFFPNSTGLELAAFRQGVAHWLPGAVVHSKLDYQSYLVRLNQCDLNLSPFPFGGLHSVIDSLRQGLPVVAMECYEPHGRTDAMLLRLLGMPEWLIAQTQEEYVRAALRVIGNDQVRLRLSEQALALNLDEQLFGDATTPLRTEVADAFWWAYENHERIQSSRTRVWYVPESLSTYI